jgi:hypothetical protein
MENENKSSSNARALTLAVIHREFATQHFQPVPCIETLRSWLDAANIPRFKANPLAKRGGGPCYYSMSHVEKFFRSRTITPI